MAHSRSKPSSVQTNWDPVAQWYHGWVGKHGSLYHRKVALPTVLRLAELRASESLIDIGCGQGVLAPHVLRANAAYTGVDASRRLLALARQVRGPKATFLYSDACHLTALPELASQRFDVAVFMLSIQDMQPLDEVLHAASQVLKANGRLVIFMTHPCFRVPRGSGWGYDASRKLPYRRIDRYLSEVGVPMKAYAEVTAHAKGTTFSFHRPLASYINTIAQAGLVLDRLEELPDPLVEPKDKTQQHDIPLFVALRAKKNPT